ncbi:hypothetical protein HY251_17880 [bacterium]|nr:hypothetical protein [bacterium]
MSEAMNKVKWQQFVKQARGLNVTEAHVKREDRSPTQVVLKYNGRARNGRIIAGEWTIETKDKEEPYVTSAIKEFLERARKDFFVKRESGLEGEAFKSVQEEEAKKTQQLAPASEEPEKKPKG